MKAFVINVVGDIGLVLAAFLIFRELGTFEYGAVFEKAPEVFTDQRVDDHRDLPAAAGRRLRQVGAAAAPHLAARRDGGPDPGLLADPRGDDGHRRRLPDRPHPRPLRARPDRRRHRRLHRPGDAAGRRHDRAGDDRPEAGDRLLDDEPDRLHGHGRLDRRLLRRHLPPDDPRLLQGAALHGGRLDHRRDGERPEHRPDVAASARRCASPRSPCSAAPSPSPPSPAPRASSPRTRSSPSPRRAAACT